MKRIFIICTVFCFLIACSGGTEVKKQNNVQSKEKETVKKNLNKYNNYYTFIEKYKESREYYDFKEMRRKNSKSTYEDLYLRARIYSTKIGVKRNMFDLLKLYIQAYQNGSHRAAVRIGEIYLLNPHLNNNYRLAFEWISKGLFFKQDMAYFYYGLMYLKGWGLKKDYEKGLEYMRKAADKGIVVANYNIGCIYYLGLGVKKAVKKAIYFFNKAADYGLDLAAYTASRAYIVYLRNRTNYKVETNFIHKISFPEHNTVIDKLRNLKLTKRLSRKEMNDYEKMIASEKSNEPHYKEYMIGMIYINGYFGIQRKNTGFRTLREAADHGNFKACYQVARRCLHGFLNRTNFDRPVESSVPDAVKYFYEAIRIYEKE